MNYKELGVKVGLEIHQQLDTNKLFCSCPSLIREDPPHGKIKRVLFPSPGETGEIDKAALEERKKGKYFVYEYYNDTNCLVEIDEEPPHDINKEALKIALTIAKMLNMDIFDEIHVMRKIVVDGSNTTGFQRTALIAENGFIELSNGKKLKIETLCLEEDSARKIEEHKDFVVYRLDRLGIPLVEITTSPDLSEPEEVKEAAYKIGRLLRATKVKRGLGTIRQDINISIKNGERVEIKGAQDLDLIPEIVKNEIERQKDLLSLREELFKRFDFLTEEEKEKIRKKEYDKELFEKIKSWLKENIKVVYFNEDEDLKIIPKEAESKILRNKEIKAIVFPKDFRGIFGFKINKYRFGRELADRVRIFGFKGLIHSDEDLKKYKLGDEDIELLKNKLGVFIMIAYTPEERNKIDKAIEAILERVALAFIGVPKETRKVNEDGTTSFLRPMPGKARMYPETDLPLYKTKDLIPETLPETLEEKEERFAKLIGKELAKQIVDHYKLHLFERLLEKYKKVNPKTLAYLFLNLEKEVKRELKKEMKEFEYEILAKLLNEDLVVKESLFEIMKNLDFKEDEDITRIKDKLKEKELLKLREEELKEKIKKDFKKLKNEGKEQKEIRKYLIKKYRLQGEMSSVMRIINELLKN